jgi:uncharacterized membrane protein YfcA
MLLFHLKTKLFILFIGFWALLILITPMDISQLFGNAAFSFLGVLGAIFANSTGAGGGVVFIPMFEKLAFSPVQSVGTSFAIQCFGMTAGAVTWFLHYRHTKQELKLWHGFKPIIAVASLASIIGLWLIYFFNQHSPHSLHQNFSWFSLVLGLFMIITLFWVKPHRERSTVSYIDWWVIIMVSLFGGMITAWLSVGVGELLAIYLILRRFDVTMAVAIAVVVSAFTVWAAIWQHTLIEFNVVWPVVVFAGPGAVIGGISAKYLVGYLSARKLKLFFAFWLIVIGGSGI